MKQLVKRFADSCAFVDRLFTSALHTIHEITRNPRNYTKLITVGGWSLMFPCFLSALIRVHLWLAFVFASQTNSLRYAGPMRPKPRQLFWLCQLICTSRASMSFHHSSNSSRLR